MQLLHFVTWLNNTPLSVWLREDDWAFGVIESFHIIGLGFSVGLILWADLRLLGIAFLGEPVSEVLSSLEKWAVLGFSVMFVSGMLLLLAEPLKCYTNVAFRIKVILLVLAGVNVAYFHSKKVFGTISDSELKTTVPWKGKLIATFSLVAWLGVIVAGRWTAYF